ALEKILKVGIVQTASPEANVHVNSVEMFQLPIINDDTEDEDELDDPEMEDENRNSLPDNVAEALDAISNGSDDIVVTLQTASVALVAGFLCKYVSDRAECGAATINIANDNEAEPLRINGIINLLDRGGFAYPATRFVAL